MKALAWASRSLADSSAAASGSVELEQRKRLSDRAVELRGNHPRRLVHAGIEMAVPRRFRQPGLARKAPTSLSHLIEDLIADLRYALRSYAKSPTLTIAIVVG